jgi:hypothetical protein
MLDYTLLKVMPLILLALLISIAYFVLLPPFCPGRSNPGRCQNMLHIGEKACDHHEEDDNVPLDRD